MPFMLEIARGGPRWFLPPMGTGFPDSGAFVPIGKDRKQVNTRKTCNLYPVKREGKESALPFTHIRPRSDLGRPAAGLKAGVQAIRRGVGPTPTTGNLQNRGYQF